MIQQPWRDGDMVEADLPRGIRGACTPDEFAQRHAAARHLGRAPHESKPKEN